MSFFYHGDMIVNEVFMSRVKCANAKNGDVARIRRMVADIPISKYKRHFYDTDAVYELNILIFEISKKVIISDNILKSIYQISMKGVCMWKTVPEATSIMNISKRTFWRRVKSEEWDTKKVPTIGGGNDTLLVNIPDDYSEEADEFIVYDKDNERMGAVSSNFENTKYEIIVAEDEISKELMRAFQDPLPVEVLDSLPSVVDKYFEEQSQPDWENARQEDRERATAKHEIIRSYIQYKMKQKAKGVSKEISSKKFIKMLHKGEVCINAFNKLNMGQIALPTLRKWESFLRSSGDMDNPVSLLEDFRFCGRKCLLDVYLRTWIKELATDERCLDPNWIYLYINDQLSFDEKQLPISKRSLQVLVREFRKDPYAMALARGKEAFRNKVKLHNVRINDLLPGELWESDGHVCNVLVKSPFYYHRDISKRYLVRPVIIAWRDVATGLVTGYRACLVENKNAVKNSLMDGISRYGVPKMGRVDNSGAYNNVEYAPYEYYKSKPGKKKLTATQKIAKRMIESGDKGLYANIGMEIHFTIPKNPESKSIEPFWDFCIGNFEKSFISWIGNKPENRPEIFKNMDNKTLVRKYGDKFPTWENFCDRLYNI